MIDLLRIVCQWHERKYLAFKVGPGVPDTAEDQPGAGDTDTVFSRNALTMTRAGVQADMGEMMRNFNVDLNALPRYPGELLDAEDACATCETVGRCYRWKHEGGRGDAPELFCPNVKLFSELAIDPFWAKAELYDWPDDPAALPWLRMLRADPKEVTDNPPDLGSDKLQAFAKVAVKIDRVAREWAPRIKRTGEPGHAETLRREADLEMAVAIEETEGMTLDDFQTIYHVALCDSTIAGKLENLLEQKTAG
ncbi:MAG: hypothetical protein ACR2Q4_12980 [Geminicoccaceae bacterium]